MKKNRVHGDARDLESIGSQEFKEGMMEVTEKELRIGEESKKTEKKNVGGKNRER